MSETTSDNGKLISIISYFGIGWVIAYIMHSSNKTDLGAFHLRQSLGITVVAILLSILVSFIGIYILSIVVQLAIVVFWVLGLIGAIQGEKKLVPVLGAQFQDWFKGIG